MSDLNAATIPSTASATSSPSKKGAGAKNRSEKHFRNKKNSNFASQLQATLFRRLHVSDPSNISEIKLQSAIIPSRIPVSLRAIPCLLLELWARMVAIGTRPFGIIAQNPINRAIFVKVSLLIMEAKVCYAQRTVEVRPPFDMPTQFSFTDMILRQIESISSKLPFPLAIALESLGHFGIDNQTVVPVFIKAVPEVASGAVNFARTEIKNLVRALAAPMQPDNVIVEIAAALNSLPNIVWVNNPDGTVNLDQATVQFWGADEILPPHERTIFLQIIAAMESKSGFLLLTDIKTGEGTAVQAVRFPEDYESDQDNTQYYMNTIVPTFDEQLAPALMYGYEFHGEAFSRFCGNYTECLKHGDSIQQEARHALIWADK